MRKPNTLSGGNTEEPMTAWWIEPVISKMTNIGSYTSVSEAILQYSNTTWSRILENLYSSLLITGDMSQRSAIMRRLPWYLRNCLYLFGRKSHYLQYFLTITCWEHLIAFVAGTTSCNLKRFGGQRWLSLAPGAATLTLNQGAEILAILLNQRQNCIVANTRLKVYQFVLYSFHC
jgi:hypothetical protein